MHNAEENVGTVNVPMQNYVLKVTYTAYLTRVSCSILQKVDLKPGNSLHPSFPDPRRYRQRALHSPL